MLTEKFTAALASARDVASNPYLVLLMETVRAVDVLANSDTVVNGYVKSLLTLLDKPDFALDPKLTNDFSQKLGEAHFYCMCLGRGIRLERVSETDTETPDFRQRGDGLNLFFEVKTPSVSKGEAGIAEALESNLDAQILLQDQTHAGAYIAMAVSEFRPYGNKLHQHGMMRGIINTLIEKTENNIKEGQFRNPNTFLVLNLAILPPSRTESAVLRPAYCNDDLFPKAISGELWMLAFCKPGMLAHGNPEFEGKPCIEGCVDKAGVLVEHPRIAGILFLVYPWRFPAKLWGLFRSADMARWQDLENSPCTSLFQLVRNRWNDDRDSNGWRLNRDQELSLQEV